MIIGCILYQRIVFFMQYDPHMKMAAGEHEGNARFEGLLPEYLTALSKQAGFDYTLHVVKDGKWGRQSSDGTWYGMVGELINNVSHKQYL